MFRGAPLIEETGSSLDAPVSPAGRYRQFAFKEGDQPDVLIVPASPRLPVDEQATLAHARSLERYRKVCEIEAFDPSAAHHRLRLAGRVLPSALGLWRRATSLART